ncbi:MAG: flagellin [Clostridium sp.]|nr:flagellin [Clostridium sp.]
MVVQHNITAVNANRQLGITTKTQAKSTEKLSSGYKINRAADDAAGLAISEKMRRQVRGLTQASLNAQDGISCVQTAEGALTEVHDMLQRMNELAVKGETGTLTSTDRDYIKKELDQLMDEVDRVQSTTTFNEKKLLDGKFDVQLQVGAEAGQHIQVKIDNMDCSSLGITAKIAAATGTETADSQAYGDFNKLVKAAIQKVSEQRADLGAVQNRLEHTVNNLDNIVENTTAAESQIRDTDIATEMVKYANNNILQQAGTSMLTQANQSNQLALSLLG